MADDFNSGNGLLAALADIARMTSLNPNDLSFQVSDANRGDLGNITATAVSEPAPVREANRLETESVPSR